MKLFYFCSHVTQSLQVNLTNLILALILRPHLCILLPVHYLEYQIALVANEIEVADAVDVTDVVTISTPLCHSYKCDNHNKLEDERWHLWKLVLDNIQGCRKHFLMGRQIANACKAHCEMIMFMTMMSSSLQ